MTLLLDLPAALEAAGVNVRTVDGWDEPARDGYFWREPNDEPAGHMHHHTAGTAYTPHLGSDKANGFAGLSHMGSDRLYQERYEGEGYEAVYTITNAYPAPISSGAGDRGVLEKVRQGIEVRGRQGPDTPGWYGNTHYWNTEWVLNGIGAPVDAEVWDMMVLVCQVQNDLMGWTPFCHICHGHHTGRKVDLWDGDKAPSNQTGFDDTIAALRQDMGGSYTPPGDDMTWADIVDDATWTKAYEDGFIEGDPAVMPQYYFANGPATEDEKKNGYNHIMREQMERT